MREDVLEFMYWILQTVHTNAVKTNKSQRGLLAYVVLSIIDFVLITMI